MTATFSDLLTTAKDRIRRSVGDTDMTVPLRTDEEIAAVLALMASDEALTIADIAAGLAVQYAQLPDSISDDGTSISWRERVKTWLAIAAQYRALSVTVVDAASGVWSEQMMRWGADLSAEYDPNRVEPGW